VYVASRSIHSGVGPIKVGVGVTALGVLVGRRVAVAATVSNIGVTVSCTPPKYPKVLILGARMPMEINPNTRINAPKYAKRRTYFLGPDSRDVTL
jgi:tartrate dehydratase alpha subunit/fumarate hydratase class I-like protein